MAVSKDLYRRLPYCIRKYLSRSQSFCLLITVLMATALFIIFQMFGLTHHIDADDIIYQSSLSRQNKLPPIIGRTKTPKTTSTTTKSTKRTFPALVRRRPVISKVFGVPSTLLDQYRPDGDNQFRCIKSGLQIPFDWVNDDFCDCPEDGSDEPSTNACRKGTFHCNGNNQNEAVLVLPSNRVNDGICDCCDGSDEWQSIQILTPMSEQLQQALGKYRPPCPDICT